MEIKVPANVMTALIINLFIFPFMKYTNSAGEEHLGLVLKGLSSDGPKATGFSLSMFVFGFLLSYVLYELAKVLYVKLKARNA